jgi:P4 family phage/plasmid primase-like protien
MNDPEQLEEAVKSFNNRTTPKLFQIEKLKEKVVMLLLTKKTREATEEITKHILEHKSIKTIRSDEKPEMWIYNNGIYEPEGKTYINQICRMVLGVAHTKHIVNEILNKIQSETYIDAQVFFNQQNQFEYLIPVQNGILNIKKKELLEFTDKIIFFNKLPMDYNPKSDCPKIKEFIKQITKDENSYLTIREIFGYCLMKNYNFEKAIMFEGKTASNGKSVLCQILKEFLNENNISSINIAEIDKQDGFALADLHNKLANFSMEISKSALDNKGKFKEITGREFISANRKFQNRIKFVNYAKLIFTANELPIPKNADDGFWRRWIRIEFPNRYLSQKEINSLSEEEKNNVYLKNTDLLKNLLIPVELEGLLNFALEGLSFLLSNGDFSIMTTIKQNKEEWLRKANSLVGFIENSVIQDYDGYILKEDFRRSYSIYCQTHKVKPLPDKSIKIILENELFAYESQIRIKDENGYEIDKPRIWKGVSFIKETKDLKKKNESVSKATSVTPYLKPPMEFKVPIGNETPCDKCGTCDKEELYLFIKSKKFVRIEEIENKFSKGDGKGLLSIEINKLLMNGDIIQNPTGCYRVLE